MSQPKPPRDEPAIRVVMMPRDTNGQGTIFGGVIMSYIDQAGYVEACRQAPHTYVTVMMNRVEFKHTSTCWLSAPPSAPKPYP
ncbi:MAG: acyl-CoA thioesterase [Planctomycetota bacterium]|jgi:acyl-CoA thioesterase YciA